MKKKTPSLRTPIGRAQGLGSARHGTEHFWAQRLTAIVLIPLLIYGVINFFMHVVFGTGYAEAIDWLRSPFSVTLVIVTLLAAFYHAALGLQVVIEDYVHCEATKLFWIVTTKLLCFTLAVLGVLSTVKILFWSLLVHA
ncbi:MAG: succinate dehydrogenase, hydrophobic membrane anchor protein [Alphaproteobacteria bacterium]|nr:succinate dehydrogenase, hydrophobic membrane anchor protein [Alphaproteobacteria bacterium]